MSQSYVRVNPSVVPGYFNPAFAYQYGLQESVMINKLQWFIFSHEVNKKEGHFHDGKYWTYSTIENFKNYFPYWSTRQVRVIIQSLIDQGILITGQFNKHWRNRTVWYTFADYDHFMQPLRIQHGPDMGHTKDMPKEPPISPPFNPMIPMQHALPPSEESSPFVKNDKSKDSRFMENHQSGTPPTNDMSPFVKNGKSLPILSPKKKTIKEEGEHTSCASEADASQSETRTIPDSEKRVACAPSHAAACSPPDFSSSDSSIEVEEEDFSHDVVQASEKFVSVLQEKSTDYKPPKNRKPLLQQIGLLLTRDGRAIDVVLTVLRYALSSKYWTGRLFASRTNPAALLRKEYVALKAEMDTTQQPRRRLVSPCSNDQATIKRWEENQDVL